MFSIISRSVIESQISSAMKAELKEINQLAIFSDFEKSLKEKMLWGIFSQFSTNDNFDEKGYYQYIGQISFSLVDKAKSFLKDNNELGEFLNKNVENIFSNKVIGIYVDFEGFKTDLVLEKDNVLPIDYSAQLALTLPDSEILFNEFLSNNYEKDKWLYEYMDKYEDWRNKVMDSLYEYKWQLGGHGRWIQDGYNGSYIAQANINIGDAGSVFLVVEDKLVKGYIDMY